MRFLLHLSFFFCFVWSTSSFGQIGKGSIALTNNGSFQFWDKKELEFTSTNSLYNFSSPTVDVHLSNHIAVGGSFNFEKIWLFSKGVYTSYSQFQINPHLKYGLYFKKIGFYTSISASYFSLNNSINTVNNKEFASFIGLGFQFNISPKIAFETWWQFPHLLKNDPALSADYFSFTGLKFYLNKDKKRLKLNPLYDRYFNKYNIRGEFNWKDFRFFEKPNLSFQQINILARNSIMDYLDAYFSYQSVKNNYEKELRLPFYNLDAKRFKFGLMVFFPFGKKVYLNAKLGLAITDIDPNFQYQNRGGIGFDAGMSVLTFIGKNGILKVGSDYEVQWAGSRAFSDQYSYVDPYASFELFLNKNVSIEPRINYQIYHTRLETDPLEYTTYLEQNWHFEVKINTLFKRRHGVFIKKEGGE